MVETWQADSAASTARISAGAARAPIADGAFELVTVKPGAAGEGAGRQAPHLSVLVFARGLLKPLFTRMYFPDEGEANLADPVLRGIEPAERDTLVAHADGDVLRFDIHLQGDAQTAFFAL